MNCWVYHLFNTIRSNTHMKWQARVIAITHKMNWWRYEKILRVILGYAIHYNFWQFKEIIKADKSTIFMSSTSLNVIFFTTSVLDARVFRAASDDVLAVLENSFTLWGSYVCLFDIMCPLSLSSGWTILIFDGIKRDF